MDTYKQNRQALDPNRRSLSPQVRIYNRYFHLQQEQRHLLEQQKLKEAKLLSNTPKITPSSYMILAEGLCQQLSQHINSILESQQTPEVDYNTLVQLLQNFVSPKDKDFDMLAEQLYLVFCHYDLEAEDHPLENLQTLFRVLLDPLAHSAPQILSVLTKTPSYESIEQQREYFLSQRPDLRSETPPLTEVISLWRAIRAKYRQFDKKKQEVEPPSTPTPKLTKKSEALAQQYRNKHRTQQTTTYQHLHKQKLQKDKPRLKTDNNDANNFRPKKPANQTLGSAREVVDRLYHVPQKSTRDLHEAIQEEELKQCTFKPQILGDTSLSRLKAPKEVKNFDKSISRQALARSRRRQQQEAYQRLGKVRSTSQKSANPPSMISKTPKIILEIKVEENRVEKIMLFGNQDPRIVAKKFVLKNGLEDEMIEIVEQLVRDYSNQYL